MGACDLFLQIKIDFNIHLDVQEPVNCYSQASNSSIGKHEVDKDAVANTQIPVISFNAK